VRGDRDGVGPADAPRLAGGWWLTSVVLLLLHGVRCSMAAFLVVSSLRGDSR